MNPHAHKKEIPDLDWNNLLSVPDAKGFVRATDKYPATLLGELAYRFRELYWRNNDHPRPTGSQVAHTAHLVGRLAKELRGTPLPRRTSEELELINYLVTPRAVWSEVRLLHRASQQIIGESFCESRKAIASLFHRGWTSGKLSVAAYHLQQIAINLACATDFDGHIAKTVSASLPAVAKYDVSPVLMGGSFALLSLCGEHGDRRATRVLMRRGLTDLAAAEDYLDGAVIEGMSKPSEFRLACFFLSDLLRAHMTVDADKCASSWIPGRNEALDITTSWLEGGRYPIRNMVQHCNELYQHGLFSEFGTLYHQNGIRNFGRLKLDDCEEPWFLMKHLSNRPIGATAGEDIILVAMSSGDHNEAYRERSWELEGIRATGEEQGWHFDYVEVRDSTELAYHILRHHQQGSRVAVLHQLGHGDPNSAEFGYLHRERRSGLEVSSLFTNKESRELCEIARESVDTWVLHNCSTAAETSGSRRRLSNLTEALYEATEKEISVVGLRGQDAFDALTHRRGSDGKVVFTGRPVWVGAKRLHGTPRGPKVA
jgi:hypothetical protein